MQGHCLVEVTLCWQISNNADMLLPDAFTWLKSGRVWYSCFVQRWIFWWSLKKDILANVIASLKPMGMMAAIHCETLYHCLNAWASPNLLLSRQCYCCSDILAISQLALTDLCTSDDQVGTESKSNSFHSRSFLDPCVTAFNKGCRLSISLAWKVFVIVRIGVRNYLEIQ